jgi:hypothetical protein
VMVDPGKCNVFEWKMPKSFDRHGGGEAAGRDVGEESLKLLGCHAT